MKTLFIVRGTGFRSFDGSVVTMCDDNPIGVDGYVSVHPHNNNDVEPVVINKSYLQPIGESSPITYKFIVQKRSELSEVETSEFNIDGAIRDSSLSSIKEFIISNLQPILRME